MAASSGYNTQKTVRRLCQNNHTYQSDYIVTSKKHCYIGRSAAHITLNIRHTFCYSKNR
jgi:hypothetical protein